MSGALQKTFAYPGSVCSSEQLLADLGKLFSWNPAVSNISLLKQIWNLNPNTFFRPFSTLLPQHGKWPIQWNETWPNQRYLESGRWKCWHLLVFCGPSFSGSAWYSKRVLVCGASHVLWEIVLCCLTLVGFMPTEKCGLMKDLLFFLTVIV